jgi:hypothetical protein
MSIELIDRGIMDATRRGYTLNANPAVGFKAAVNNGQTRLALEYAEILIEQLMSRVAQLESQQLGEEATVSTEDAISEPKEKPIRQKRQVQEKETAQEVQ